MDIDDSSNFSDMSIDNSDVKVDVIKNIDDDFHDEFENAEYAEDMEKHIRKMEVSFLHYLNVAKNLLIDRGNQKS